MPHTVPKPQPNSRLRIGAALGLLSVLGLVAFGLMSYLSMDRWIAHTVEVRQEADDWLVALLEAQAGVRGYIMSGQRQALGTYESAVRRERRQAGVVGALVSDNQVQARNAALAAETALATMTALRELATLMATGHRDEAIARLGTGGDETRHMTAFREAFDRLRAEEGTLLEKRRLKARRRALLTLAAETLLMFSCAIVLIAAWFRERSHQATVHRIAVAARLNLAAVADLAVALSDVRDRRGVASAIADRAMRAMGADTFTLHVANEDGTELRLLADRGVAQAVLARISSMSERSAQAGLFAQLRSGSSTWVENEAQYAAAFPVLAAMKVEGQRAKAFWSVPLRVEGQIMGLLGMGFYQPRTFSAEERAFVETYAKLCAQALQRAIRLEREDEAQRWFTTTLRSIGDAVIATDAAGHITFMNPDSGGADRIGRWPTRAGGTWTRCSVFSPRRPAPPWKVRWPKSSAKGRWSAWPTIPCCVPSTGSRSPSTTAARPSCPSKVSCREWSSSFETSRTTNSSACGGSSCLGLAKR